MQKPKKNRSLVFTLSVILVSLMYSLVAFHTKHVMGAAIALPLRADDTGADGTPMVFLPLVRSEGTPAAVENEPRLPDSYPSEQDAAPPLPDAPETGVCQSLIRFANYTNTAIYIYWNRPDGTDVFYKLLDAGRQYWQHTYQGNRWNIRDEQGRLIKSVTAVRCENTFVDTYIGDLPACGRITTVALWDIPNDRAVGGFDALSNGTIIPFDKLPNTNLRIAIEEVVESIKFNLNGDIVISNVGPYSYPALQQPWDPEEGVYTLVIDAYRQNDAQSALCDQRRLTLQIGNSSTPVPTFTPTDVLPPTPTSTSSATPLLTPTSTNSATPTPTAPAITPSPPTVTSTATPTKVPATPTSNVTSTSTASPTTTPVKCPGNITGLRLFNLTTGQPIAAHNPLADNAVIDLTTLPANFNVEVGVTGAVESVVITINGAAIVESFVPYRYPSGDTVPWQPAPGSYTIRAVAYSQDNGQGAVCDTHVQFLTFTRSTSTATPTPTATPTITPTPVVGAYCIGDWVWDDSDGDGLQDASESGLAGVGVYIGRDDDNNGRIDRILATTNTSSTGHYLFCYLAPATYLVEFDAAPGCINTLANQGNNDAIDSDASVGYGITSPIVLKAGDANSTVDAGYICN